ncbi:FAD-dependent oxidoreductase domain-containing protein 1-like [Colias croceus]|uniref:FAD-dependent oxidoreductase domain-containing protein 1-like n=1 Tax=Colias crocea TaxID=72248 RepID=UPI001E27E371|nr:FAD-dependent oxidoreductase domain-containing protein 1-like [Colias croceus]
MFSITKIYSRKYINIRTYVQHQNPFQRTFEALTGDIRFGKLTETPPSKHPEHADIVIIGGGFLGSSAAYWLKILAGKGLNVVVLDREFNNSAPRKIPIGIISHHFSLPENILLSKFSADFIRNTKEHLGTNVNVRFQPHGYLVLASDNYCDLLERNVSVLKEYAIKNELLSPEQIKKKYPWINVSDVKLGCLSTECEGVFDSSALLRGMMEKSIELGATYVNGNVVGFEVDNQRDVLIEGVKPMSYQKLTRVIYRNKENEERAIKFAVCILANGYESPEVLKLAKGENDNALLSIPLPIEKREVNLYSLGENSAKASIGLNSPLVMDSSGLWLRRNGLKNNLICGQIPVKSDKHLSNEENYERIFKPSLHNRFPSFSDMKVNNLDSEVYDCNTYDESGIIGPHPYHINVILATGFGKLGIQHSPGIGKAIAELIVEGRYTTTDLTRLGFDRILVNEPLVDFNIY